MKNVVVYYSFTGNTHRIAQLMVDVLKEKGEEAIPVRIRPLKEEKNFFMQCAEAFFSRKPELYRTLLDLKDFDRIIIGCPVWAFKPVPAINTYLEKCSSLDGKNAVCFVTYGSGVGKDKTLAIMKGRVEARGARVEATVSFQQDEDNEKCREWMSKNL